MTRRSFNAIALTAIILTAVISACGVNNKKNYEDGFRMTVRAGIILDSIYSHYGVPGTALLHENYPSDADYQATYLAGDAPNSSPLFSYLWPFSGTLSAAGALYAGHPSDSVLEIIDRKVLPALNLYADTVREPAAYASYINTEAQNDRFYDDNIWLGIDFTDLYRATRRPEFLDKAQMIWKFIESGTDSVLGGGIYWCEQKKHSKNTCSNAPGTVLALKLYEATQDPEMLHKARALYDWTRSNLRDPEDGLYFDNISLDGKISKAKFAYNSGQMLQAAAMLYRLTNQKHYLDDAEEIAASAHRHFFNGGTATADGVEFPLINKGDVWFTAVMMRGFEELWKITGEKKYMDDFVKNLDYAWSHSRDKNSGLFSQDWSGKEPNKRKWLLTQGAMAEMMARAGAYLDARH